MAFSNTQQSSEGLTLRLSRPKWLLLGQEGGALLRAQVSRVLGGGIAAALTPVFDYHLFLDMIAYTN